MQTRGAPRKPSASEGSMRSHQRTGTNQKRHREKADATLTCCCKMASASTRHRRRGASTRGEVEPDLAPRESSHKAVLSSTTWEAPSP